MTLERMILLIIGVIVLGCVLLSIYHSVYWLWVNGLMAWALIAHVQLAHGRHQMNFWIWSLPLPGHAELMRR